MAVTRLQVQFGKQRLSQPSSIAIVGCNSKYLGIVKDLGRVHAIKYDMIQTVFASHFDYLRKRLFGSSSRYPTVDCDYLRNVFLPTLFLCCSTVSHVSLTRYFWVSDSGKETCVVLCATDDEHPIPVRKLGDFQLFLLTCPPPPNKETCN